MLGQHRTPAITDTKNSNWSSASSSPIILRRQPQEFPLLVPVGRQLVGEYLLHGEVECGREVVLETKKVVDK